jgi:Putative beta-barrel porin 2
VSAAMTAACLALPRVAPADEVKKHAKRHRLGPLYFDAALLLKNAGVDTNVFQTLQNPVRDQVVVVSPRLDGDLALGTRLHATGFGFAELHYFRTQGEERSTDFYGQGDTSLALGPWTLTAGGGGGQFTQRVSIEVDDRLTHQEKRGHVEGLWRMTPRVTTTLRGSGESLDFAAGTLRNGQDIKEALDRETVTVGGDLRYELTPRTDLVVSADRAEDRFVSEPAEFPRSRESYRALGGFELRESVSGRVPYGRLVAGVREFPGTLEQGNPSYTGPVGSGEIVWPVGRLARLRAGADRDVLYASSVVDLGTLRYRNGLVLTRYVGEALAPLPGRLVLLASGGFEQARYLLPYPYPDQLTLAPRLDHRWSGSLALSRRFGEVFRAGGFVTWARRVSNLPLYSYQGLTYGLNAEVTP